MLMQGPSDRPAAETKGRAGARPPPARVRTPGSRPRPGAAEVGRAKHERRGAARAGRQSRLHADDLPRRRRYPAPPRRQGPDHAQAGGDRRGRRRGAGSVARRRFSADSSRDAPLRSALRAAAAPGASLRLRRERTLLLRSHRCLASLRRRRRRPERGRGRQHRHFGAQWARNVKEPCAGHSHALRSDVSIFVGGSGMILKRRPGPLGNP